jgi:hypothetical protein
MSFVMLQGTPDTYYLQITPIVPGLYGLIYNGFWGSKSWWLIATNADQAMFCQSLHIAETSITNIWDLSFIRAVRNLEAVGNRSLYEMYYDEQPQEISHVTHDNCVHWEYVDETFEQVFGYPQPDFPSFEWVQAQVEKEIA